MRKTCRTPEAAPKQAVGKSNHPSCGYLLGKMWVVRILVRGKRKSVGTDFERSGKKLKQKALPFRRSLIF